VSPRLMAAAVLMSVTTATACSAAPGAPPSADNAARRTTRGPSTSAPAPAPVPAPAATIAPALLPGMPPPVAANDVWAADRAGALSPAVHGMPERVYVPNSKSDTVTVINPRTFRVLRTVPVGHEPQHVVPSWDLKTLWVNNDLGNSLTPINPATGRFGRSVRVDDPYNLYFTPDGRYAIVMASARHQLDFRDPRTMKLHKRVPVPCAGVNHADFAADGRHFLVSCEFSGQLLEVNTAAQRITKVWRLPGSASTMPQDVKLSTDGKIFWVSGRYDGVVYAISTSTGRLLHKVKVGVAPHGLCIYPQPGRYSLGHTGVFR
jgi:YVTN family beta-propeller protein